MNGDRYGISRISILYTDLVGMLILFTKISRFHHENQQFLRHPIKFADSSTIPDCITKLTFEATGRIFVGAWSKHAPELQNDKKMESLLTMKYFYLVTFRAFTC